jgi:integrase/recombinase XerD
MTETAHTPKERMLLQTAFEKFQTVYLPTKYRSPVTRRGYTYDLTEWLATTSLTYVDQLDLDVIHVYLAKLEQKGLKAASRQRKAAAIKAFLTYLEVNLHLLSPDFSNGLIWPTVGKDEPRSLSEAQYTAIMREASYDPRDAAMLELLLQTGIRLSELTGLTLDDLTLPTKPSNDPVNGFGLMRIRRKGGRLQELVLNYKACRALKTYLKVRPNADSPTVFLTKYKTPMTNRSVEKAFKKYAVAAGVPWAHVHTFRTTHITYHLANKTDIKTVMVNAGHRSLRTTQYYADLVKEAQIKAMQEHAL